MSNHRRRRDNNDDTTNTITTNNHHHTSLARLRLVLLPVLLLLVGTSLWYGQLVHPPPTELDVLHAMLSQTINVDPNENAPKLNLRELLHNNDHKAQTTTLRTTATKTTLPIPNHASTGTTSTQATTAEHTKTNTNTHNQRRDQQSQHPPMNVVLFYADDWTMNVMGKLNSNVHTPNIDRMADKGMLFTNNCVTTSMCWISRATLMTGLYASVHGQHSPSIHAMFESVPWNRTLFPLLKRAGYYTGIVGKWHAPQPPQYIPHTFDYTNFYFGEHWMERGGQRRHVTDLNREDALDFLHKRPRDQLFALKVSFFATHAWDGRYPSYQPMNKSKAEWYVDNTTTLPMPQTATEQAWQDLPHFFRGGNNEARNRWISRWEPAYFQKTIRDLYRMATEVDEAIGEIIQELKVQGVYNNTLLIFTTDNGNLQGEHGLAEKWHPFEESIRVPLVIQDPRMPKTLQGTRNEDWTLNIDLAPTILGAAQIPPSDFMQGRDIAELYLDENPRKWRQDFFYEFNRGHPVTAEGHEWKYFIDASFALITKEWKYVYWPQHDYEQLFHRSLDPYDEWDVLKHPNVTQVQTTDKIYIQMKDRYAFLKNWTQSGNHV